MRYSDSPESVAEVRLALADRIKNTLIKNAKLKKQYAKIKAQQQNASKEIIGGNDDEAMSGVSDGATDAEMAVSDSEDNDERAESASPKTADPRRVRRQRNPTRMQEDSPGSLRPRLKKRKSGEMLEAERDVNDDGEQGIAPAPGPDRPAGSSSTPFVHPSRRNGPSKGKEREITVEEPQRKRQRLSEREIDALREKREADKKAWAKKGKTGQPNMVR